MRATSKHSQTALALILAFSAASAHAQQSVQDFQLPPAPTPTATPQVEGPVDDSGIIPVGPRVVPDATPTANTANPTPTPSPAQTQPTRSQSENAVPRPIVQPSPASSGRGRDAQPSTQRRAPQAAPTSRGTQPTPDQPAAVSETASDEQAADATADASTQANVAAPSAPIAQSSEPAPSTAKAGEGLPASWPWWIAGLALAFLALLAGWFFRQRSAAPVKSAGLAQNPVATATGGKADNPQRAAASQPDLALQLEIEQLSRSIMAMTLKCRVTLSNRSDRAARDIAICADLVCANRQLPMDAQIANEASFLPKVGNADRLGPHKTQSLAATLTIPIQQVAAFKHDNRPMFVPLVRIRMDCKDHEPIFRTFVVGIGADPTLQSSSKLHPIPLDGIPGSYQGVRSRPIANPTPS